MPAHPPPPFPSHTSSSNFSPWKKQLLSCQDSPSISPATTAPEAIALISCCIISIQHLLKLRWLGTDCCLVARDEAGGPSWASLYIAPHQTRSLCSTTLHVPLNTTKKALCIHAPDVPYKREASNQVHPEQLTGGIQQHCRHFSTYF